MFRNAVKFEWEEEEDYTYAVEQKFLKCVDKISFDFDLPILI